MKRFLLALIAFAFVISPAIAYVYSGSCGATGSYVTYTLDTETGLLKIEGKGEMVKFNNMSYDPWYYDKKAIKNVEIVEGVTSIGAKAFYECTNIESITIPNSIEKIGLNAFYGCTSLQNPVYNKHLFAYLPVSYSGIYTIPEGISYIGSGAFSDCVKLTSVNIPNSVKTIGDWAFSRSGLTTITIPNTVETISEYAFRNCSYLISLNLGNSVVSIGNYAFSDCSGLNSITIPRSVTDIGNGIFSSCSSLVTIKVDEGNQKYDSRENCNAIIERATNKMIVGCKTTVIPNSVVSIGNYAFHNCTGLTSLSMPNSVVSIGDNAFYGCTELTSLPISNSVTSIGNFAYDGCTGLTSIEIPQSVKSMGADAFSGCINLVRVDITDLEKWCNIAFSGNRSNPMYSAKAAMFLNNSEIKKLEIPETITSVENYTFCGCSSINSVVLHDKVTSVGYGAFEECANIKSVTCFATTPPELKDAFFPNSCVIHVLPGYGSKYKERTNWKKYAIQEDAKKLVSSIEITPSQLELKPGESAKLTTVVYPADATDNTLAWTSTNAKVAIVGNDGLIEAQAPGTADIVCKAQDGSDVMATCTVVVGVTDISDISNIVYTDNQSVFKGKTFTLPIKMKNSKEEIVGFQCDIVLPICISLEKNSRGNVKAPTFNAETDRTSNDFHTVTAESQQDGSVRVLCYSNSNDVILGTDGVVCDFYATMAKSAKPGYYSVVLKNITMTTTAASKYTVPEATFYVVVPSFIKGDANGDEDVDVADISSTANEIMGNQSESFVRGAADVDEDGILDVADIAGIANIILYGEYNSNLAHGKAVMQKVLGTPVLEVKSFNVSSGATKASPTLDLTNSGYEFCGFQCDMYFPEGVDWSKNSRGKLSSPNFNVQADRTSNEYHTVSAVEQADGAVRILCYSTKNELFLGEDGAILDLPITFSEGLADGDYEVEIKNIVLSRPTQSKVTLDNNSFHIYVGNVEDVNIGDANNDGDVTVTDIVAIANHILGGTVPDFNVKNADSNGDGVITVTDIVCVAQYILTGQWPTHSQVKAIMRRMGIRE